MSITYGSVCSGIESASVAWEPLGMSPLWFAEIEKFPSAVLAHHWPRVPNLGDMTMIADLIKCGMTPAPELLVGGTPCQAFSVAGKRESLDDTRGQLTLEYVRLLNAIDEQRKQPAVCVWENVPGVLNTKDNAFGCFLGELAGSGRELQPPNGKRWGNAGLINGPRRSIAWRVLDAQFFGVAQRRRRVFVVASARDGFDPGQVLFEFDGVRRDSKPSREEGQSATAAARGGSHWDGAEVHPTLNQSHNTGGIAQSNQEIFGQRGSGLVPAFFTAAQREEFKESTVGTCLQACDNGRTLVSLALPYNVPPAIPPSLPVCVQGSMIGRTEKNGPQGAGVNIDHSFTLNTTNRHAVCVHATQDPCTNSGWAFAQNSRNEVRLENGDSQITGALSTGGGKPGQGYLAVCTITGDDVTHTLDTCNSGKGSSEDGTGRGTPVGLFRTPVVRKLTPVECERLQGFPNNHTRIAWRGKPAAECPDGPRYKAIGNSKAVPVVHWVGKRILDHLEALSNTSNN